MPGRPLPCCRQRQPWRCRQRGAALLVMLFLAVALFSTVLVSALTNVNLATQRQLKTLAALAQAKQALIDWSVLQGDVGTGTNPRPGTLPCPDTANLGTQAASCAQAGGTTVGRLPWKTLGLEDLRDADGERLWYALSNDFRRAGGLNNKSINSDTPGTLQLYSANGTTLLTPAGDELAAVIFSVGAPLSGQDRTAGPNTAANYLDNGNGRNNAMASGPFIAGPAKNVSGDIVVNDIALGISAKELITAVEKRALKEAQNALALFAAANGNKFPNPANYNGANCTGTISNVASPTICSSDPTTCFGRLPEDVLYPTYVATWFRQNGWGRVITYAVNKNDAFDNTGTNCSTSLNVLGQTKRYVLLAPGAPRSGQTRPSTTLNNYLENSENSDAWTLSVAQPSFSTPSTASNDLLRSLP